MTTLKEDAGRTRSSSQQQYEEDLFLQLSLMESANRLAVEGELWCYIDPVRSLGLTSPQIANAPA